jgi:hypothetical protein
MPHPAVVAQTGSDTQNGTLVWPDPHTPFHAGAVSRYRPSGNRHGDVPCDDLRG